MKEIVELLCRECKGKCCAGFPVFVKDVENDRMFQNPTYYDEVTMRATLMCSAKLNGTYACYYYSLGGCPPEIKPELCQKWFCSLFDEIVLGSIRPIHTGSEAKWITRHLLEVLA